MWHLHTLWFILLNISLIWFAPTILCCQSTCRVLCTYFDDPHPIWVPNTQARSYVSWCISSGGSSSVLGFKGCLILQFCLLLSPFYLVNLILWICNVLVMWSGYQGVLVYGLGDWEYGFIGFMGKDIGIKIGASLPLPVSVFIYLFWPIFVLVSASSAWLIRGLFPSVLHLFCFLVLFMDLSLHTSILPFSQLPDTMAAPSRWI